MGTYLSTPVVDKGEESGETLECESSPLAWGVVDMQGWRKSMEDAHVAQTNVSVPPHLKLVSAADDSPATGDAKVFGVFDGHGGPEVARFCQLYIVDVLTKQMAWLEEARTKASPNDHASTPVGLALIHTFHALDRMIDDMKRRDELIALRAFKPPYAERRTTDSIPIPPVKDEPSTFVEIAMNTAHTKNKETNTPEEAKAHDTTIQETKIEGPSSDKDVLKPSKLIPPSTATESGDENEDDDSNEPAGKENASKDQDLMLDDDGEEDQPGNVAVMLQKILPLTGGSGQVEIDHIPKSPDKPKSAAPTSKPKIIASITQNGRLICNLPDHTIHAGCTAIVAVIIGRTLTVANAGDSRAVLCRAGGKTEALSFDHKPQQDREMERIHKAGGFVNQFGRVNGNLNLSRSIGDLKYKQVPGIPPAGQMITAEPDIVQAILHPNDEFIILGCDGIWDCLTNEQAVKYVRERIDTKTPVEIGIEMLDEIISEDPRSTQGIGGDNMTIMVIDLQPQQRAYR